MFPKVPQDIPDRFEVPASTFLLGTSFLTVISKGTYIILRISTVSFFFKQPILKKYSFPGNNYSKQDSLRLYPCRNLIHISYSQGNLREPYFLRISCWKGSAPSKNTCNKIGSPRFPW
jgi:hypothetical protein